MLYGKKYEALEWLRRNPNPGALGFNVLRTTQNAIKLVQGLYENGAVHVWVTNVNDHPGTVAQEGGPSSDTLLVKPPTLGKNWAYFLRALCALDADEVNVRKDGTIRVWWD